MEEYKEEMRKVYFYIGICISVIAILVSINNDVSAYSVNYKVVAEGLSKLGNCGANFEFLPDGRIICGGLRDGKIYIITLKEGGFEYKEIGHVNVYFGEEGESAIERGLVGLAIDPEFDTNRYVYLHYSIKGDDGKQYTRVARFTLDDNEMLTDMKILLEKPGNKVHIGGPMTFGPDNTLYITNGDAGGLIVAQQMDTLAGKILRINRDGSIPIDNPFPNSPIYTLGHRNVFGIAVHPITGILYITENGPDTDDELNILEPGKNYGWPHILGYRVNDVNEQYKVTDEDIVNYKRPLFSSGNNVIGPTNMIFYTSDRYGEEFKYNIFFTTVHDDTKYGNGAIYRVILKPPYYTEIEDIKVYKMPTILVDIEEYDGYIYIGGVGNDRSDKIYKITSFNLLNVIQASTITLDVPSVIRKYDPVELTATVKDVQGRPIKSGYVNFMINDNIIATVKIVEGVAKVSYAFINEGKQKISATFFLDGYAKSMYEEIVIVKSIDTAVIQSEELEDKKIDEFEGPVYEDLLNDGTIVKVMLSDDLDINKPTKILVEFYDKNGERIDKEYNIVIMQEGEVIYESMKNEQHIVHAKLTGKATIQLNVDDERKEFSSVVVPEFPTYVTGILALSIILLVIIANRDYRYLINRYI